MDKIKIFIGVDQTGATKPNGQPRPLNVSIIDQRKSKKTYITGLKIDNLNLKSIQDLLQKNIPAVKNDKVLICIDTVFGLPKQLKVLPIDLFKFAKNYAFLDKPFGAITAYKFFSRFLQTTKVQHRKVELLVKANSVFNLQPYQKNIGCGSFRIIKDLAQDAKWFSLWPFDDLNRQFIIAEGYPSYFWKTHIKSPQRKLDVLKKQFANLKFKNMDQADSFVLAYGASQSTKNLLDGKIKVNCKYEGWILGVPYV